MTQNIESFSLRITYVTDGDLVEMQTTGHRCKTCGESWVPDYYGQPPAYWDSSSRHRCPKAPVTPPVLEAEAEQGWDV